MPKSTELSRILRNAAANVNSQLSVPLKKVLEKGDAEKGYGLYRDSEFNEFRVIHVADGEWLSKADYCTSDKGDAEGTGDIFLNPVREEPVAAEAEAARPLPTRPRGFYAQPSKLLQGLLARA